MKKVLLVFDDYNELSTTEVYLKKVGFDVVGISNEAKLADQLLAFNPDIVVANGRSTRVASLSVGAKLKENSRFHGRVVIVLPKGVRPGPQDLAKARMDLMLEAPLNPITLIQGLARLGNLDVISLVEKFKKATLSDPTLKEKFRQLALLELSESQAAAKPSEKEFADRKRIERYGQILAGQKVDPHFSTFSKSEVKGRQAELQKDWNQQELAELDRLKQEFVQALFKKE